jgi:hypothetical protein
MSEEMVKRSPLGLAWEQQGNRVVTAALASATLGLAPFYPHAHIWKQLVNLAHGTLRAPMDVFDLVMHGAPWVALIVALSQLFIRASVLATAQRSAQ